MDKLKILKFVVFMMMFCIALLLCLAIVKVASNNRDKTLALDLSLSEEKKITNAFAQDDRLFVIIDHSQIMIVDLKKMILNGKINLNRGEKHDPKE